MLNDSSSREFYINARNYPPITNRFQSPDSIVPNPADPQSLNRFSYVRNNPINFNDPTGHVACSLLGNSADSSGCLAGQLTTSATTGVLSSCLLPKQPPVASSRSVFMWTVKSLHWMAQQGATVEQELAFVMRKEVGEFLLTDSGQTIIDAITSKYNQYCGDSVFSPTCVNSFWGYYEPMLNLFGSDESKSIALKILDKTEPNSEIYYDAAAQIMSRPNLPWGGGIPSEWVTVYTDINANLFDEFEKATIGSQNDQVISMIRYLHKPADPDTGSPPVYALFVVLTPNQQSYHCGGENCTTRP